MARPFSAGGSHNSLRYGIAFALILDLPFLIILFALDGGFEGITILVAAIPLTVSTLFIWLSYAARKMTYVFEDSGLRISFPASPLYLPYHAIRSAEKVVTTLTFKLFGGSWPGVHWGLFTTKDQGRVRAYVTYYKGEFLLMGLADGSKILLSPSELNLMLEELRKRVDFSSTVTVAPEAYGVSRRFVLGQVAVVMAAWMLLAAYVATIYGGLPEIIPVHWGFDGRVNRYGGKVEVLWLLGVSTIFPVMNTILTLKFGKYDKGLPIILGIAFLFALAIFGLIFWTIASSV
jgi:hypothetical protein